MSLGTKVPGGAVTACSELSKTQTPQEPSCTGACDFHCTHEGILWSWPYRDLLGCLPEGEAVPKFRHKAGLAAFS